MSNREMCRGVFRAHVLDRAGALTSIASTWACGSMKPGATTIPRALTVRTAGPQRPTQTILSRAMGPRSRTRRGLYASHQETSWVFRWGVWKMTQGISSASRYR